MGATVEMMLIQEDLLGHVCQDRLRLRLRLSLFTLISMPQQAATSYRDMQANPPAHLYMCGA